MTYRLLLDARLLHYNRTGIGRYIRHLYDSMARAHPGYELTIGYSWRDAERGLSRVSPRATALWTPPHHPAERWALAAELVRHRPTLVHSPDHVCPQPLSWRAVLTVHDLAFWRMPESHERASRAYYDGLRRSAEQATRIICVSHATKRDLLNECPGVAEKVRVVHEAPDPMYQSASRQPSALASGRPYFVFVGTIAPRKNVARIVQAFAQVVARTDGSDRPELLIVGADGYGAAAVRQLPAALGIASHVRFLGPQPAGEVVRLYQNTLALVFPSLLEGFGLPVLEAMAASAPVSTSNRTSLPEVAGEAALLVDPEDVDDLAEAMLGLATDESLRERLRTAGRAQASRFSWERTARETLAVFAEAVA
ncbi:MAG: glycosyltransferase family 4 protein [Chloroflexota bacterium]